MRSGHELLEITSKLDARYHLLRGEMERSKETTLLEVARILKEAAAPYALIGGAAVQFHCKEPRTTLDVDLAVLDDAAIPRDRLERSGFRRKGRFEHSEKDDQRRRSKRVQVLADALRLVEDNPGILGSLSEAERARLDPV
jgi:hypothetical protein